MRTPEAPSLPFAVVKAESLGLKSRLRGLRAESCWVRARGGQHLDFAVAHSEGSGGHGDVPQKALGLVQRGNGVVELKHLALLHPAPRTPNSSSSRELFKSPDVMATVLDDVNNRSLIEDHPPARMAFGE